MNSSHPDWPFSRDMLLHQSPDDDADGEEEEEDEGNDDQTNDGYSE
jgi:hypothetical protein